MSGTVSPDRPAVAARPSSSAASFWLVFLALLGLGLLFGAAASAVVSGRDSGAASPTAVATVELGDLFISPATLAVPAGNSGVIEVRNAGQMPHDLTLEGGRSSRLLSPGETRTVSFGSLAASATLFCSVPGHRAAGMETTLTVTGVVR